MPITLLIVSVAGAAGAALGGRASRLRPSTLGALLAASVAVFGAAALLHRPLAVVGIAVAYGLYQLVLVVTDARLQQRIEGPSRATVTSVASLGTELTAIAVFASLAAGQPDARGRRRDRGGGRPAPDARPQGSRPRRRQGLGEGEHQAVEGHGLVGQMAYRWARLLPISRGMNRTRMFVTVLGALFLSSVGVGVILGQEDQPSQLVAAAVTDSTTTTVARPTTTRAPATTVAPTTTTVPKPATTVRRDPGGDGPAGHRAPGHRAADDPASHHRAADDTTTVPAYDPVQCAVDQPRLPRRPACTTPRPGWPLLQPGHCPALYWG